MSSTGFHIMLTYVLVFWHYQLPTKELLHITTICLLKSGRNILKLTLLYYATYSDLYWIHLLKWICHTSRLHWKKSVGPTQMEWIRRRSNISNYRKGNKDQTFIMLIPETASFPGLFDIKLKTMKWYFSNLTTIFRFK